MRGKSDKLTPMQELFVAEWMVDFNGKQAAIRAGYAPANAEVTASKLLSQAKVQAEVKRRKERIAKRIEITAADISRVAWEIATSGESESARVSALSLLAKRHREFSEKQEHSGADGGPIVIERPTREL